MFKFILSLLFILAISAPSYADTLLKRYKNANLYRVNGATKKLVVGGDISNAYPFDSDGPMRPQSYKWTDAEEIALNVYRLKRGDFGYTVYKNTGEIRIHPVRKRWDVYYSIANSSPVVLNHRQVSDKLLELYVNTSQVRYSFFIGDQGFKINTRLKANYSGGDEWSHVYNVALQGLIRTGRLLYFNGNPVGKLPNPFMVDAEGTVASVTETLNSGQLTVTASGISSLVLPVDIDPTLGPINPTKDTALLENIPTFGLGQAATNSLRSGTGANARLLTQLDISAIPAGVTVTSSDLQWIPHSETANADGRTYSMLRSTRTDWEDAGILTADAEANWNNYKDPNVAWTTAGGDIDATVSDGSFTFNSADIGSFKSHTIDTLCQDAIDNRSGILSIFVKDDAEGNATTEGFDVRTLEWTTAAERPKLTVEYLDVNDPQTHLGYRFMEFF